MIRKASIVAFLLLAVATAAADSPYTWFIAHPDGRVTEGEGEQIEWRPLMPGTHIITVVVQYEHIDPQTGEPYRTTATEIVEVTGADVRRIFSDGFETGATGVWSMTIGGSQ